MSIDPWTLYIGPPISHYKNFLCIYVVVSSDTPTGSQVPARPYMFISWELQAVF